MYKPGRREREVKCCVSHLNLRIAAKTTDVGLPPTVTALSGTPKRKPPKRR